MWCPLVLCAFTGSYNPELLVISHLGSLSMNSLCNELLLLKNVPIGWVQWLMPVIPVLWVAKAGGLPEDRSLKPALTTW